ncbi:MAG TPA: DUF4149 domain-containing protein [Steroidobacter sp.]|uniref:DUF4149 domain-containing protein n=1 Tax=Steroidobacter sp. TaxID=1978227 RepID=UPI002ED93651
MTLWAGSLWTVCGIVAPQLFATLPERQLAGQMAGRLFHIETWLGVTVATALIAIFAARKAFATSKTVLWLILLTAGAPLASELILGPMMDAARTANDMVRFGMLHGISAVLFFSACLTALGLVWQTRQLGGVAAPTRQAE